MSIRIKIFVNKSKVLDNTYAISAGQNLYISTFQGVPEGSTYRIRFIVRDALTGQKSKGGFKKIVDCVEEPDTTTTTTLPTTTTTLPTTTTTLPTTTTTLPTTTTTLPTSCLFNALRGLSFQTLVDCIDVVSPDTTTTTTTTDPTTTDPTTTEGDDDFCEGLILEEGDVCEGPLTDDNGNDFFEWDEYDEDVYLTDGSYQVQYFYTEDSLQLAATGINLSNIVISSILLFLSGIFYFTKSRKKRLLSAIRIVDSKDLETVYKNVFKLKKQIEKTFKEEVNININLDSINPYGVHQNQVSDRIKKINNIAAELDYTKVAVINLVEQFNNSEKVLTKEIMLDSIKLISSGLFEISFTGEVITKSSEERYAKVKKLSKAKLRTQKKYSAKYTRLSLGFSSVLIFLGVGLGIYAMQQIHFTGLQHQASQEVLSQIYQSNDNDSNFTATQAPKFNERILSIFNDVPVFETLADSFITNNTNTPIDYTPDVFGKLEIESIKLNQFIVSGTDEQSLEFGPGHYIQTAFPGAGGNVGIAGHRTTFGAPFANLDKVELGDELILTVGAYKYHYEVDEVTIVEAVGGEYVLYNRGDDRLTLTTCHPKYSAKQRLIVTGILTKIETVN
jgi:LPXTG-site transpeptidase (sortase) family protein